MATQAMKLVDLAETLDVKFRFADAQKRAESKGKGCVHHLLCAVAGGSPSPIYFQLPRGVTYGVRVSKNNTSKYQLTVKYREDQIAMAVDPLREIHTKIKQAVLDNFHILLPKTTSLLISRLTKKDKKFPSNVFDTAASPAVVAYRATFTNEARERLDEIFIFGASEEDHDNQYGKSKMVAFAPAKQGNDGKTYEKSYMVNISCPVRNKRGGGFEVHASDDGKLRPVFTFSACEGPESNLKSTNVVSSEEVLDRMGPVDGAPFARDGIAVVGLPYMHIGADESGISVNVCLEHFHMLTRDDGLSKKRTFAIMQDDETPQQAAEEDEADEEDESGEDGDDSQ
jgi:hypothetical protein